MLSYLLIVLPFYCSVAFHCVDIPPFVYPFTESKILLKLLLVQSLAFFLKSCLWSLFIYRFLFCPFSFSYKVCVAESLSLQLPADLIPPGAAPRAVLSPQYSCPVAAAFREWFRFRFGPFGKTVKDPCLVVPLTGILAAVDALCLGIRWGCQLVLFYRSFPAWSWNTFIKMHFPSPVICWSSRSVVSGTWHTFNMQF